MNESQSPPPPPCSVHTISNKSSICIVLLSPVVVLLLSVVGCDDGCIRFIFVSFSTLEGGIAMESANILINFGLAFLRSAHTTLSLFIFVIFLYNSALLPPWVVKQKLSAAALMSPRLHYTFKNKQEYIFGGLVRCSQSFDSQKSKQKKSHNPILLHVIARYQYIFPSNGTKTNSSGSL